MKLKQEIKDILLFFISWRILLFAILFIAIKTLSHSQNFLGGGKELYENNPYLWAWSNFDGEHYLSIARYGYKALQYFFFPLYPIIVRLISFGGSLKTYSIMSQIVSTASFLFALVGLSKLSKIDFNKPIQRNVILLLLLFPTSFFFISTYTESLFLALTVWSFYFARKGDFLKACLLASLSTATRILGVAVILAIFYEYFEQNKLNFLKGKIFKNKSILYLLLSPLGLVFYMVYLKIHTGSYFEFFNTISIFGEQRSTSLVLFPQVFYRYFFKILPNLNYSALIFIFTPYLEVLIAFLFFILLCVSWHKLRKSYFVYFASGFVISTLSGSFSSFPRYSLVLFPGFIVLSLFFSKLSKIFKVIVVLILSSLLFVSLAFFTRGYFVS